MTDLSMYERINHVAGSVAGKYRGYVSRDDVAQELHAYALGGGARHLAKFVADDDEFRVMRALFGAAEKYARAEKAGQSGYSPDDEAWYSPFRLADLIPLALDPDWDGLTGESDDSGRGSKGAAREGGTLLAMVCDIRHAVRRGNLPGGVGSYDPTSESGQANLAALTDRLGGERPDAPGYERGRRRAMSNAQCQAITGDGWAA